MAADGRRTLLARAQASMKRQRDFIELDQVRAIEGIESCVCEISHTLKRIAHAVEKLASIEPASGFT